MNVTRPSGEEPFNGELCRSRSTQTSNAVGCSQRWAATITVSFPQRGGMAERRPAPSFRVKRLQPGSATPPLFVFLVCVILGARKTPQVRPQIHRLERRLAPVIDG